MSQSRRRFTTNQVISDDGLVDGGLEDLENDDVEAPTSKKSTSSRKGSSELLTVNDSNQVLFKPFFDEATVIFYIEFLKTNGYGVLFSDINDLIHFSVQHSMRTVQNETPLWAHYDQLAAQLNGQKSKKSFWTKIGEKKPVPEIGKLTSKIIYYTATVNQKFLALILLISL